MKANSILKIAVVAMAALGAYAFSGNNANDLKPFSIEEGDVCTNILAGCSRNDEGTTCMIFYNNTSIPVFELGCVELAKHDDSNYVSWQ